MKTVLQKIGGFFRHIAKSGVLFAVLLILSFVLATLTLYTLNTDYALCIPPESGEQYVLSDAPDRLLADLNGELDLRGEKIRITFFMMRENLSLHATGSAVLRTAEQLAEAFPNSIELYYVNLITLLDENGNYFDKTALDGESLTSTTVVVSCGTDYARRRVFSSQSFSDFFTFASSTASSVSTYNGEEVLTAAILRVGSMEQTRTALFTSLHGESSDAAFVNTVIAAGYDVDTVNLKTCAQEDLNAASLVIISSPINDFERAAEGSGIDSEIEKLTKYLQNGGHLFVTVDPYVSRLTNLEKFLADNGLGMETDAETGNRRIVRDTEQAITLNAYTIVSNFGGGKDASAMSEKIASSGRVILREAAALSVGENAESILVSSSSASLVTEGETVNTDGSYTLAAAATVKNTGNGEDGRILLSASAYVTAYDALTGNGYANKDFFYSACEVLFGAKNQPYGCRAVSYYTDTLENLTMGEARIYMILILLLPLAVAICGAAVCLRRKYR